MAIKNGDICEIIDGQQRTTILMLVVTCIRHKFGSQLSTPELCPLVNESFTGFSKIMNAAFDNASLPQHEWEAALRSDDYRQYERIKKLWTELMESELLSNRHQARDILKNLKESTFNVIASYSDNANASIEYFLDVNLKGIRLDTEDIFKGYLFSQDDRPEIKDLWKANKQKVLRLNGVTQGEKEKRYPLMKLYEHFFYCDLYLPRGGNSEYASIKFGENFCLTSEYKIGSTVLYEDSHLIEAIGDRDYLKSVLERVGRCVEIMTDIIESEGPSAAFKALFDDCAQVDSVDIRNCHNILKKVLLEKEIIPKIMALKYISAFLDGEKHTKQEYKSIYTVFCATVLFTIFASKKESDTFYGFVKSEDWIHAIHVWLSTYMGSHSLTRGKISAAYRFTNGEEDPIAQYRCKALGAINNFLRLKKQGDRYIVLVSNPAELSAFLNDNTKYSVEHLIIAKSGSLHVKTKKYDFQYKYSTATKKYRDSIFNYVFIPESINGELSNNSFLDKISVLESRREEINCIYSKRYIDMLSTSPRQYFPKYPTKQQIDQALTEDEVRSIFDEYFAKSFPDELLAFSMELVKKIEFAE